MIPKPPGWKAKHAGHHWIDRFDSDGHFLGTVLLQWAPAAQRWCYSGMVGMGEYANVSEHCKYSAECPMPELAPKEVA